MMKFDNEIVSIQESISEEEEEQEEEELSRETNPGPDYKPPVAQPITFYYCGLDQVELERRPDKAMDFNPNLFWKVFRCPLCLETYKGVSEKDLALVRDPEIKVIIETLE